MEVTEDQISNIVEAVLKNVQSQLGDMPAARAGTSPKGEDGIFATIDEAVTHALAAQEQFVELGLSKRVEIIRAIRDAMEENARTLAEMAVRESGFGRIEDKVKKNLLAAKKAPGTEALPAAAKSGDDGLTLVERGPYGVIGSITPTTNPVATITSNAISMLAGGNSVVFNPHPRSKGVTNRAIQIINQAVVTAGGPPNLLGSVIEPTIETSNELMNHPRIRMLMVTGGPGVVTVAMKTGKKVVAAGPGNPPVIVDDTANIPRAAKDIVDGASFDNNVLCIAEKEVYCFEDVTDPLKEEMKKHGAYEISGKQIEDLISLVFVDPAGEHPKVNTKWVGIDAWRILREIDIRVNEDVRLIIAEVPDEHPFVNAEMLMPVLPIVRVSTIEEALERAKRAEHGFRHTACMHSESVSNMSYVARYIDTTIFVKNAPSYAGLGFGGEGHASLSIAGPTGEGITGPFAFTRERRCVLAGSFRIV